MTTLMKHDDSSPNHGNPIIFFCLRCSKSWRGFTTRWCRRSTRLHLPSGAPEATWPSLGRGRRPRCAAHPWRWWCPGTNCEGRSQANERKMRKGSIRKTSPHQAPLPQQEPVSLPAGGSAEPPPPQPLGRAGLSHRRQPLGASKPMLDPARGRGWPWGAGSRRIRRSGGGRRPPSSPPFGEGRGHQPRRAGRTVRRYSIGSD